MTTPATLEEKYDEAVSAEALFFNNGRNKALRVEAPTLNKEFTDGAYIGRDPHGQLYFNSARIFDVSKIFNYKVFKVTHKGVIYAHIKFYFDNEDKCHLEFLGKDHLGAVASAGMDGYSSSGNWRDLKLSTSPAKVTKDRNTQTIIVAIDQRDVPTATITDSMNVLNDKVVDVVGTFYYKEIGLVNTGKYANYNNDRIVFYSNDYSGDDFTGFFMPFEYSETRLGSINSLTFENITWASK